MALQYWYNKGEKRTKIIVLEDSYHGDTFGSMSLSARSAFTQAFNDWLFEVEVVPVPVEGREEEAVNAIQAIVNTGDAAAFIFEPMVQGVAGMQVMERRALSEMVRVCKDAGVVCIGDEVFTGFGRTGKVFASEFLSTRPDIYCLSKGLTGGTMALGVTTCNQTIYDAFVSEDRLKTFFHGHSFTANPLACAAALASMDLLMRQETFAAIQHISNRHFDFYTKIHNHPRVKAIRHKGTILAIEIKNDEETSYFNNIGQTAHEYFMERGVFLRPLGNVLYTLPPYCISDADLDEIYAALEGFLNS
jgi:adenosylmethionine-8-amino-7-oxononanoate aminotransferase